MNLNSDIKLSFFPVAPIAQSPLLTAVRQISGCQQWKKNAEILIYQMWTSAEKGRSRLIIKKTSIYKTQDVPIRKVTIANAADFDPNFARPLYF